MDLMVGENDNNHKDIQGSAVGWRMRDMAQDLLSRRVRGEEFTNREKPMPLSNQFDVDTCLARIRRDKAAVIRSAFEAAASAVLDSLDRSGDSHSSSQDTDVESINGEDLPSIFSETKQLSELRVASLERAYDNKDAAKRKIARQQELPRNEKELGKSRTAKGGGGGGGPGRKKSDAPKFTRNTPASSAAALDSRLTSSRAILCTAANVTFEALTPPLPGLDVDIADVPQNPRNNKTLDENKPTVNNMGTVVVEAQTLGQRIEAVSENAAQRSTRRNYFRQCNVKYDKPKKAYFEIHNPFAWKDEEIVLDDGEDGIVDDGHVYKPSQDSMTAAWGDVCLPRLKSILHTGAGHAVYHDVNWTSRHGRIANLLQELSREDKSFGPHLIVTVEPDVERFTQEFRGVNSHLRLMSMVNTESLRCLKYTGTSERRSKLRKKFSEATGLPEAPFHVIVTSYANFLQDYLHFCQLPFETVVMDDGVSWMAAAQGDPNSPIGRVWDEAIWSKNDQQMGLAGSVEKEWDYSLEEFDDNILKEAWVGLTARHRLATSSTLKVNQRSYSDTLPVSGIVNFVLPHYAESVREEWDRSRIATDTECMKHFRKLLTRSIVVHDSKTDEKDIYKLALQALQGDLPTADRSNNPDVPDLIADETFVSDGKVAFSRRNALLWLGLPEESWLRYELGMVKFQHILDAMKASTSHGHLCEEIVTASSTTSSGMTGQVIGTMAYRLAIRCGRHFGSEQGLRQHHSALHAPPGTWLCRTCGGDCITSQARTHHERSCGQPSSAGGSENSNGMTSSTPGGKNVGKGGRQPGAPNGNSGKKKAKGPQGAATGEEKDPDGSLRVPCYRGIWVNQAGKHFVKIDGKRFSGDNSETVYFDSVDEAAKKHDSILKEKKATGKVEYNFKADGSRIVYEDVTTSSTTGLGGSASSVVPALSVINIKDLPPEVKPLLRDPRQTSRTGGNSKRHVYAYRGVCRQARKGHDRWQSQISFMGVNHYLGTFDSEWDAAAIYAWAHLILYGEEATKQAQKEGEEAAAAYYQEKKDIAEGKIPAAPPKPEKKPKKLGKKEKEGDDGKPKEKGKPGRKKRVITDDSGGEKKKRGVVDKESITPILNKGVSKAIVLAPRWQFVGVSDSELAEQVSKRLAAAQKLQYCVTDLGIPAPVDINFRSCAPVTSDTIRVGGAMLLGLASRLFGWSAQSCIADRSFDSDFQHNKALSSLLAQYGEKGLNESFRTIVQGTTTIIGCASVRTQRVYESMGLGTSPIGGAIGSIDCHIGGSSQCCSEASACIRYFPTASGDFQFSALSSNDIITMNGQRITPEMGSFPLFNEDICTVGPRVFTFLLPIDT